MPSINKIQVNNTTYEIVPGDVDYQFCIEEGIIDNSSNIYFLAYGNQANGENYVYYGADASSSIVPLRSTDIKFCYKVNNITNEIALVALINGDFSDPSNLVLNGMTMGVLHKH